MYPNPQEALPLTARPNLEHYRKLAKGLVKACTADDPHGIHAWTTRWLGRLGVTPDDNIIESFETYARGRLTKAGCALTTAQFVIARAHGFPGWPTFAKHIESLGRAGSPVYAYEKAVEAIVAGDGEALARLLRKYPSLVRVRSSREHGATLLHYVSANGVEGFRQKSPKNAARIARMLLEAGADVEATTDVYEGNCTALGLVATSGPPFVAGVQHDVIEVLLDHGARTDVRGSAGRKKGLLHSCLANGQPDAAAYLASRGAPLDLQSAAGLGRLDAVRDLLPRASHKNVIDAFLYAAAYGHAPVVDCFIAHGIDVDATLTSAWHGVGHTALHVAAFHGQSDSVKTLLGRGARIDAIDKTWKTPPLLWALTGWRRSGHSGQYYEVVAALVAAGARLTPDIEHWNSVQADSKMLAALRSNMQGT
jgi:hypothetical protein